ncbi:MAG: hypothetical protein DRI61_12645, partial [Chloroflexi bacterium]
GFLDAKTNRWVRLLPLLIGFTLRMWGLASQPIWWDEARNIVVASRPLTAIATSGELDIHPPLYFYFLHFWMRLGGWDSPYGVISVDLASGTVRDGAFAFFLRFLSLVFGVLALAIFYRLGRELGGEATGLMAAALSSLAPFWVLEAQQTRMYTLMLACLLGAGLCLWRGIKQSRANWFVGYGLLAALSLLAHYSAIWVLAGWGIFLVWWVVWPTLSLRRLLLVTAAHGVSAIAFLPQLPIAWRQVSGYSNPNLAIPSIPAYLGHLAQAWTTGEAWQSPVVIPLLMLGGALCLTGIAMRWRCSTLDKPLFLLSWLIPPLVFYYLSFFRRGGAFEPRYIACVSPALYLTIGESCNAWFRMQRRIGVFLGLSACVALLVGLTMEFLHPSFVREDSRALVSYLAVSSTPQDFIIIDAPFPFNLYWPGFAEQPGASSTEAAPARYLFADIHTVSETLTKWLRGRRHVFLVHWFKSDADPRGVIRWLLDRHGEFMGKVDFTGYTVYRYRLPSEGVSFALAPSPIAINRSFGGGLVLEEADWGGREPTATSVPSDVPYAAPGHQVWVATRWRLTKPTDRVLKAACYLLDEENTILAQDDRWLLNDRHLRTPYWGELNEAWAFHSLSVPLGTLPGEYRIALAVYDEATQERLPLLDKAGNPQGTELVLGKITLVSPLQPALPPVFHPRFPIEVDLGQVRFLGYDGWPSSLSPGQTLRFRTYWEARVPNPDTPVPVALVDEKGHRALEAKLYPLGNRQKEINWREGEVFWSWLKIPLPPELPQGKYEVVLGEGKQRVSLGPMEVKGRPRLFEIPPIPHPLEAYFEPGILLLGYDWEIKGTELRLTLFWQCQAPITRSYTVFTHLLDGRGRYITGHDAPPAGGRAPTETWHPGEVVVDEHRWKLPSGLPPGIYTVEVGLYEPEVEGMPRVPIRGDGDSVSWEIRF